MRRVLVGLAWMTALTAGLGLLGCKGDEAPPEGAASQASAATEPTPGPTLEPRPVTPPAPQPPDQPAELDPRAVALAEAMDADAYLADLRFIAAPRPPGSEHWRAVQDRCAETLAAAGFEVARISADGAGTSVVGYKPGADPELPAIVVGAHYDHIEDCAGADDNASGTAAALAVARSLGGTANHWQRDLYVACWDEEESGLHGSRRWADQAVGEGKRFALYFNFDAIAYTDKTPGSQRLPPGSELLFAKQLEQLDARGRPGDFIGVLSDSDAHRAGVRYLAHAERLELEAALLEIPASRRNAKLLSDLRRSDHASFWRHEIPALFLSDTADFRTDTYHCEGRPDTVETLDLEFAVKVTRAAVGVLSDELGAAE